MNFVDKIYELLVERDLVEKGQSEMIVSMNRLISSNIQYKQSSHNPNLTETLLSQELNATRKELSTQYKIQSTNAQRLLALSESLAILTSSSAKDSQQVLNLTNDNEFLTSKLDWLNQTIKEKENQLQILSDDSHSINLELTQLEIKNQNLKLDNSTLLSRWIESKNSQVDAMNQQNEMKSSS